MAFYYASAGASDAQVVIVGMPLDRTSSFIPGARFGPDVTRLAADNIESFSPYQKRDISGISIHDAGNLEFTFPTPAAPLELIAATTGRNLARGVRQLALGGEHTITIGAVQAMREQFPGMSVLHLDAHADLRDSYLGARYSQATTMRRIHELCPVVEAGVRSLSLAERRYVDEYAVPVVFWPPEPGSDWVATVLEKLGNDVYLTIDADVFDSALLPWVGTPEPGGPSWSDIWALLRRVATTRHIVGFDVVEFAPYAEGAASSAYMLARLIYRLIGYIHRRNLAQEAMHND